MRRELVRIARADAHTLTDALSAWLAVTASNVDPGVHAATWAQQDAEQALKSIAHAMGFQVVAKPVAAPRERDQAIVQSQATEEVA